MCQYGFKGLSDSGICCLVSRLCYIFALTSMSLSEFSFLCDIMGGTLKISFFSKGCCCIRYHFLVKISLRVESAGWYRPFYRLLIGHNAHSHLKHMKRFTLPPNVFSHFTTPVKKKSLRSLLQCNDLKEKDVLLPG